MEGIRGDGKVLISRLQFYGGVWSCVRARASGLENNTLRHHSQIWCWPLNWWWEKTLDLFSAEKGSCWYMSSIWKFYLDELKQQNDRVPTNWWSSVGAVYYTYHSVIGLLSVVTVLIIFLMTWLLVMNYVGEGFWTVGLFHSLWHKAKQYVTKTST